MEVVAMKRTEEQVRLERALAREVLETMNWMTFLWMRGTGQVSRTEFVKIKKQHAH